MAYDVQKTDEQWREELSPEEYAVLRQAGTERAFTGEYTDTETEGTYSCKACGSELFTSDTKFHSGCGWPSFYQPMTDTVEYIEDNSAGMKRVEVRCATCGSHLGHVFPDGFGTPDRRPLLHQLREHHAQGEVLARGRVRTPVGPLPRAHSAHWHRAPS